MKKMNERRECFNRRSSLALAIIFSCTSCALLLTGCDNFLNSDTSFKSLLTEEVKIATAEEVSVTVAPALSAHGQVTTSPSTAKVGVPFAVAFEVDGSYTFGKWAAYSNFTATTDTPLTTDYVTFSDNSNASYCEVTVLKKVENLRIVPVCGARPTVVLTEPLAAEKGVMRTTPVKITFSKAMDLSSFVTEDGDGNKSFSNNITITYVTANDSSATASSAITLFDAANTSLKNNGAQLVIPFGDALTETAWLSAGCYVTVTVNGSVCASDGVPLGSNYSWTFVTGATGDAEGPILSSAALSITDGTTPVVLPSTTWSDWATFEKYRYGSTYGNFIYSIKADDSSSGNAGVLRYEITQRLMYADIGAKLPNGNTIDSATNFFDRNGQWNDVLGCTKTDFEKTTEISGDETGISNALVELNPIFNNTSGIYQITLTAVDKLENYASDAKTYYFVRDVTSPTLTKNGAKISVSGGISGSSKYFNSNYATVTYKPTEAFVDEGLVSANSLTTGSTKVYWRVALSTSIQNCNKAYNWTDWFDAAGTVYPSITLTDFSKEQTYYTYVQFKDDLGNISSEELSAEATIYFDKTLPTIKITPESSTCKLITSEDGNSVIVYSNYASEKIAITPYDAISGVKTTTLIVDSVSDVFSSTYTIMKGKTYIFTVTDNAENIRNVQVSIETMASYGSPLLLREPEVTDPDITSSYKEYSVNKGAATLFINYTAKWTDGNVKFEIYALSNSTKETAAKTPFAKEMISIPDYAITSYKIYRAYADYTSQDEYGFISNGSSYADTDDVLDSKTNITDSVSVIENTNDIKGFIYFEIYATAIPSHFKEDVQKECSITISNTINSAVYKVTMGYDKEPPIPTTASESANAKISVKNGDYFLTRYGTEDSVNLPSYDILTQLNYTEIGSTYDSSAPNDVCYVQIDGDETEMKYVESISVSPGTVLRYYDGFGKYTKVTTAYAKDTTGPAMTVAAAATTTVDSSSCYWYTEGKGITISFYDNEAGYEKCYYTAQNKETNITTSYWSHDSTITLIPGAKTLYPVDAYTSLGVVKSNTFYVNYDDTAPTCEITDIAPYSISRVTSGRGTEKLYGISNKNTTTGISDRGLQNKDLDYYITTKINTDPPYYATPMISILFKIGEDGVGVKKNGIEIITENGTTGVDVNEGTTFSESKPVAYTYFLYFMSAALSGKNGISIRVTDLLGHTYTSPLFSIENQDLTPPRLSKIESKTANIMQTGTGTGTVEEFSVYTGGASVTTASVSVTFVDDGVGMNNNICFYGTTGYYSTDTYYYNGNYVTLTAGNTYSFSGEDIFGNMGGLDNNPITVKVKVIADTVPSGAVPSITK